MTVLISLPSQQVLLQLLAVRQQLQVFAAAAHPMHQAVPHPLLQLAAQLLPAAAWLHDASQLDPPRAALASCCRNEQKMGCQWCAGGRMTHPLP